MINNTFDGQMDIRLIQIIGTTGIKRFPFTGIGNGAIIILLWGVGFTEFVYLL